MSVKSTSLLFLICLFLFRNKSLSKALWKGIPLYLRDLNILSSNKISATERDDSTVVNLSSSNDVKKR